MKTIIVLSEMWTLDDLVFSHSAQINQISDQYFVPAEIISNLQKLCIHILDKCRYSFPDIRINSGWRSKTLNDLIKGKKNSQHLYGKAADISCRDLNGLWQMLREIEVDQAIRYNTFIHVSYDSVVCRHQYIDMRNQKRQ